MVPLKRAVIWLGLRASSLVAPLRTARLQIKRLLNFEMRSADHGALYPLYFSPGIRSFAPPER